jgi:hypothetical protein
LADRIHGNDNLLDLKIGAFCNGGDVSSKIAIERLLNHPLTAEQYFELKNSLARSIKKVKKISIPIPGQVNMSVADFLAQFKKGSKRFRNILEKSRSFKIKCKQKTTVKTFFRLIAMQIPVEIYLEKLNSQWCDFSLTNKLREFIYKFRNNILGINTRVSHFNENVNRGCTFCVVTNTVPVPKRLLYIYFLNVR